MIQHRKFLTAAIVLFVGTFDTQAFAQQGYEFGVRFRPQTFSGFSFRGQTFQPVRNQPIQFRTINFPALNTPPIRLDRRRQEQQSTSAANTIQLSTRRGRLSIFDRQIESTSQGGGAWPRAALSQSASAPPNPSSSRRLLAAQRNPFAPVEVGIHSRSPAHDDGAVSRLARRTDGRSTRIAGASSRDSRRLSIATPNRSAIRLSADAFTKRSYR